MTISEYLGMLMFISMVLSIYLYVTLRDEIKVDRYTEMITFAAVILSSIVIIFGIFWVSQGGLL